MTRLFQVVLDGTATEFTFDRTEKVKLVDKMVELQEQFPKSKVTFLKIDLLTGNEIEKIWKCEN